MGTGRGTTWQIEMTPHVVVPAEAEKGGQAGGSMAGAQRGSTNKLKRLLNARTSVSPSLFHACTSRIESATKEGREGQLAQEKEGKLLVSWEVRDGGDGGRVAAPSGLT